VSARRLPMLDGWCTATVLPPFVKCTLKKDAAQWLRLGLQVLETCSPRLRHMQRRADPMESRSIPVSLPHKIRALRF